MLCWLMYWWHMLIYTNQLPVSGLLSPWCLGADVNYKYVLPPHLSLRGRSWIERRRSSRATQNFYSIGKSYITSSLLYCSGLCACFSDQARCWWPKSCWCTVVPLNPTHSLTHSDDSEKQTKGISVIGTTARHCYGCLSDFWAMDVILCWIITEICLKKRQLDFFSNKSLWWFNILTLCFCVIHSVRRLFGPVAIPAQFLTFVFNPWDLYYEGC